MMMIMAVLATALGLGACAQHKEAATTTTAGGRQLPVSEAGGGRRRRGAGPDGSELTQPMGRMNTKPVWFLSRR